jgi:hypothetical protein
MTFMEKIPTLFQRDPDDRKRVLPEADPACQWVLDGEGIATRKYDGTCVLLDENGTWWARREVRPGRTRPPGYRPVTTDDNTGKTMVQLCPLPRRGGRRVAAGAAVRHLRAHRGEDQRQSRGSTGTRAHRPLRGGAPGRPSRTGRTPCVAARAPGVRGHRLAPPGRSPGEDQVPGLRAAGLIVHSAVRSLARRPRDSAVVTPFPRGWSCASRRSVNNRRLLPAT